MNQLTQQGLVIIEGRATYERIITSVRDMETPEAITQILNFIKIYPEFSQAHNDLAVLYYQAGNSLKALAHYEKAHKLDPANITYRKNLADFYFIELEWTDDAIQTYLEILKDNPFDVETLNALGTISTQIGRREQARQYFTRTLQLDAVNSHARQALQQLGEQLPASPTLPQFRVQAMAGPSVPGPADIPQPVFQQPVQNPDQLYRNALDLASSGKLSEARLLLEELIKYDPAYALAHNDLGVLYQQDGDLTVARHHHEQAVRLQPDNATFLKNHADLLYISFGETETALQQYVKVLQSSPRDIETLTAISRICLETGKTDDARSFLETILKIEPGNLTAREALAGLTATSQEIQAEPAAHRTADEIYAEAQRLVQDDRLDEAHTLLEELVHHNAGHALAQNDLGVLRHRLGDMEGARRAYERAVELQPSNSNFRKNLADLYFTALGRTDEAIHMYLDLFRIQPRDVETLLALGYISAAVGRPGEAKSFYRRALEIEPWNAETRAALQKMA